MKKAVAISILFCSLAFADENQKPMPIVDNIAPTEKITKTPPIPQTTKPIETKSQIKQNWWEALLYDLIFGLFLPIFVPVLSALVFWLIRKLGLKVELEMLDQLSLKAAQYAEQKGAEFLKEKGRKMPGAKKEEWAWKLIESIDEKIKAKEKVRNKLRKLIISKIPQVEAEVKKAIALKGM